MSPFHGIWWEHLLLCSSPFFFFFLSWHRTAVKNWLQSFTGENGLLSALPLCGPAWLVVAVFGWIGALQERSALGVCARAQLDAEAQEGTAVSLLFLLCVCDLAISKLGSFCIVSLYKYCVYTHTDTHTCTNTNPRTKLYEWRAD